MRPTLSPSARVNELPPLDVRLAALLYSPGKGAGGADAAGTGGSALREACCPAARGCGGTSNGWVGSDSAGAGLDSTGAGVDFVVGADLARDADLVTPGGAIRGVTGGGSASAFRAGALLSAAGLPDETYRSRPRGYPVAAPVCAPTGDPSGRWAAYS